MKIISFAITVSACLGALACSTPKMAVPPDIASGSEMLEVNDRSAWSGALADEGFRVGPYQVINVDRDWDSSSGFAVGGYSQSATDSGYTFKFKAAKNSWGAKCAAKASEKGAQLGAGFELSFRFAELACKCEAGDKHVSVVIKSKGQSFEGTLTTESGAFPISSIAELENGGSTSKPSGYRADNPTAQKPVGAVDVMHPGRIWLNRELAEEQRQAASCLFAGLMLYKPKE